MDDVFNEGERHLKKELEKQILKQVGKEGLKEIKKQLNDSDSSSDSSSDSGSDSGDSGSDSGSDSSDSGSKNKEVTKSKPKLTLKSKITKDDSKKVVEPVINTNVVKKKIQITKKVEKVDNKVGHIDDDELNEYKNRNK
jgi:hypothetical protein